MENSASLVALGAVLALIVLVITELLKNWLTSRSRKRQHRTYVYLQMQSVLRVLNMLKTSYEVNRRYLRRDMHLLDKVIEPLSDVQTSRFILQRPDMYENFIMLIASLNLFATDIHSLDEVDPFNGHNGASLEELINPSNGNGHDKPEAVRPNPIRRERSDMSWLKKYTELIDLRRQTEDLIRTLSY